MTRLVSIVMIDDDTVGLLARRMLLNQMARQRGVDAAIHTFRSGHALMAAMHRGDVAHVNLILLDYDMPGTSGDQVCADLRNTLPTTPIIIYSAFDDGTRIIRSEEAGATAFGHKDASRVDEQFTVFLDVATGRGFPEATPDWLTCFT